MADAETIIIGAGAAGLAAAGSLIATGQRVLVLEARDRIGGRVHTVHDERWPLPIERGAEFIHGRPLETWDIVRAAGLRAYDVTNAHWASVRGRPKKNGTSWDQMDELMGRLKRVPKSDTTFEAFLKRMCADLPRNVRQMARAFVEGLDAAHADVVSARSIKQSEDDGETFDADTPFRIVDGYDGVIDWLAKDLPVGSVKLNAIVKVIRWSKGRVEIETENDDRFAAERAIITLPIGVLRAGTVRFDPPLPPAMSGAIEHMRMGAVVKVIMRFAEPFWERGSWRDLSFVHRPGAAFPTWWTMSPMRQPVLTAWSGGPAAEAMSHRTEADVVDVALTTLSKLIDVSRPSLRKQLLDSHVADWQSDPFARGAYAFVAAGGTGAVEQLRRPITKTLFFAGEATHPGYAGTVAAAIASGRRAAKQAG